MTCQDVDGKLTGTGHGAEMIALYCSTSGLLSRLEELIAASDYTTTDCRETLPVMLGDDATVGVVGLEDCTDRDVAWLKGVFGRCMSTPRGVVVTPLRLDVLQRLRPLGNDRFEVVWSEEADGRLPEVLREMDRDRHREPLRRLGERILSQCEIRPRLRPVIRCLCNLDRDSSPPREEDDGGAGRAGPRHAGHPGPLLEGSGAVEVQSEAVARRGPCSCGPWDGVPRPHGIRWPADPDITAERWSDMPSTWRA